MATTQDKEIVLTEVGTKPKKKKRRRRRQRNPIPTSMRNNSELNHPALTKGQKKFLGSICTVYSTENMKQNIEEQYVRQLMYEKDKGIIKNADWVKYLDYFCQSSKRKHLFKQPNRNVTRAKTVKVRSRFYGNGPILAPLPPIPRSPSGSPRERTTEDSKPVSNTNYVTTIRRDEDKQEDVLENDPVDAQVTVIGDDDDVVAAGVEKVDKASADEEEELSNVDLENTVEPAESDETQEESDEAVESAKKTKRVTIAEDKPDDDSSDEEKEASSAKVSADEEKTKEDDDDSGAFGKAWAKSDISPSTNEETPPETDEESTTTELPPPEESSTEAVASAVEADEVSSKADELSTTEELPSTTDEQTTETTEEPPEEQTTQTTEEPPEEQTTETTEEPPEEQPSTTEEPSTHTTEEPSSVVVETTTSEDKTPPPPPLGVPTIDLFTLLDQPTLEESVEPERSKSRIE